jgi:hypothetical protein
LEEVYSVPVPFVVLLVLIVQFVVEPFYFPVRDDLLRDDGLLVGRIGDHFLVVFVGCLLALFGWLRILAGDVRFVLLGIRAC